MPFEHGHALIIGVGSYVNLPRWNVPITVSDATAIAEVLRDPRSAGYADARVTLLKDAQATRDGILAALDALAQADEDATIFFFYAGHGHYGDDKTYYLTTHDTRATPSGMVAQGSAIPHAELLDRLRAIKAKRVLLIFNACHAGELSPAALGVEVETFSGAPVPSIAADAILATGSGRVIITACREEQFSYTGSGPRTLFGQALVDGLKGIGVAPQHGYISVFDLYSKLFFSVGEAVEHIPEATRAQYSAKQEPELTILKGVGPFAVALYQGATALGVLDATSTPPDETAVRAVPEARAKNALRAFPSMITTSQVHTGAVVHGDVGGDVVTTEQHDGVNLGIDNTIGAIGAITGGDRAGGSIDRRSGTVIEGDQFVMSGNFQGAFVNIKSTLSNVTQAIGRLPASQPDAKQELQKLIAQLELQLRQVAASSPEQAEAVAQMARSLVDQAAVSTPNKTLLRITANGLNAAAQDFAPLLPALATTAARITDVVLAMVA